MLIEAWKAWSGPLALMVSVWPHYVFHVLSVCMCVVTLRAPPPVFVHAFFLSFVFNLCRGFLGTLHGAQVTHR